MAPPDGYLELVEAQSPALFRRALLLSHDWHLAEDLVQETAVTALTKWRQVRAARNPAGYLQTVLTNHYLSRTRKRSFSEAPTDIIIPSSVDPWPGIDLEIQVAEGLAVLAPLERAVVVARYLDDQSVAEVARVIGRTESWVRVTAHRALAKLREDMAPPESESPAGESTPPAGSGSDSTPTLPQSSGEPETDSDEGVQP